MSLLETINAKYTIALLLSSALFNRHHLTLLLQHFLLHNIGTVKMHSQIRADTV